MRNNEQPLSEQLLEKKPLEEKKPSEEKKPTKNKKTKTFWPKNSNSDRNFAFWMVLRVVLLISIAGFAVWSVHGIAQQATMWIKQKTTDISLTTIRPQDVLNVMEKSNYVLPLTLAQQNKKQGEKTPRSSEIFFPNYSNEYNSSIRNSSLLSEIELPFNTLIEKWQADFADGGNYPFTLAYDVTHYGPSNVSIGNSNSLRASMDADFYSPSEQAKLMRNYAFYARINFDAKGNMSIPEWYGVDTRWRDQLLFDQLQHRALVQDTNGNETEAADVFRSSSQTERIQQPKSFSLIYALPRDYGLSPTHINAYRTPAMKAGGFAQVCLLAVFGALLAGLLPPNRRPRLPLEFWLLGSALSLFLYPYFILHSYDNGLWNDALREWLKPTSAFVLWIIVLSFWCGLSAFLFQAVRQGFGKEMARGSLVVRFVLWLHAFDASDRSLTKVLLVHFGVVSAIVILAAEIRYYALFALVPYLLAVTYRIKKDKDRIVKAYDRLFLSVQSMAKGNLDVRVEEDLGVFEPMKQEIMHIGEGFKHAVEEETKSQRMKSELVTNVSHDLKTPVTAILTYIDLLRQADLPDEERRAYIEVLSGKSQRLSRLIEDLFEYTRASSGNAFIAPVEVDLSELLKQSRLEAEDKLNENDVQIRFALPDHKVVLPLDSEKTFRIFENLYLNIAKYAMPGSRAYIQLTDDGREVRVTFKNMSAAELDFTPDEIVERFARGDRSRHTEGSGLGLAIVKSLVELQGGIFAVELDGDLFKAVIRWTRADQSAGEIRAAE